MPGTTDSGVSSGVATLEREINVYHPARLRGDVGDYDFFITPMASSLRSLLIITDTFIRVVPSSLLSFCLRTQLTHNDKLPVILLYCLFFRMIPRSLPDL